MMKPIKQTTPRVCASCGAAIEAGESFTDGFTSKRVWCHRLPCVEAAANE